MEFPADFGLQFTPPVGYFEILSGLEDVSEDKPTKGVLAGQILTIDSFKAITKSIKIRIKFRIYTPSAASGTTSAIKIRTYTNNTKLTIIDEDIEKATITVQDFRILFF